MQNYYPLVWVAFIVCLFFVWFFSHRAAHKERMMMIEKGMDIADRRKGADLNFLWRKIGIVVIGLSVGLLVITHFVALNILEKGGNALPIAILGFFGGISLVVANYSKRKPRE